MPSLTEEKRRQYVALRDGFAAELPSKVEALAAACRRAAEPGWMDDAHRLAHRLVGSAGNYGFAEASQAARTLETLLAVRLRDGIHLPDADVDAALAALGEAAARAADESSLRARQRHSRVLLVDDDTDVLDFLAFHLGAIELDVERTTSGEDALARISARLPDLIVADVRMPGMSGYELCREVRRRGFDDVPFLFCSVLGEVPQRVLGLRMGADDYLVKPVNPDELALRVLKQLERKKRIASMAARASVEGEIVLQGTLGQVRVADLLQMLQPFAPDDLHISVSDGAAGEVFVSGGRIVHAVAPPHRGDKAFLRLLALHDGRFRVVRGRSEEPPTLDERIEPALLNGLARLDEANALRDGLGDRLALRADADLTSRPLDQGVLEVLTLVERLSSLDAVLEESALTDLATLRIVSSLVKEGLLLDRRG